MNIPNTNYFKANSNNNGELLLRQKLITVLFSVLMTLPFIGFSQMGELPEHTIKYDKTISLESNSGINRSSDGTQEITEEVNVPEATWLRLSFDKVDLGSNSTITITSKLDGASQILDAAGIKEWSNTSAYFNGNGVDIKLSIDPSDPSASVHLSELIVGEPTAINRSQCGSNDDRRDSNDAAIGRMVPIGCTGWIIRNGRLVTAGHCATSRAQVIEFNVPKSNPNRSIVHPGPEDQYPIGNFVTPYANSPSTANDWAVFRASNNSQTGLSPIQAQGKSFNVVRDAPGANITITGFGTDTGIDNQTQQIHTGPLESVTNTFVRYRTDTEGGNSGSPIIDTATGNALGVHAYGGCSTNGGAAGTGRNFGERATIPAFWDAMGLDSTPPPPPTGDCANEVDSFPYRESFEGSIGAWTQATGDDLNWTVNSGGTPSNGTGPTSAVDGNSYIYVEASGNGTGFPTKNAILNSPCLDFSRVNAPSLNFQYHMEGNAVGSLNVEVRTNNSGAWNSVFSRSGSQGSDWNTASVDLSGVARNSSVQLRLNVVTGNSWQGDITIDALSITNGGTNPGSDCESLDFNDFTISSFTTNQDTDGNSSVTNNGDGLSLSNNTWKAIALNYEVTANTVIEFDFTSTSQGEIHAVGFEDDNELTQTRYFKVHGTQNYGVTNFDNYAGGTTNYVIPVGNFYTGAMNRLVFINDNDTGSGNTSVFANVKIYEGSCGESATAESVIAGLESTRAIVGDEPEDVFADTKISPNPTSDAFSIQVNSLVGKANATIFSILGKKHAQIELQAGDNTISAKELSLAQGIYLIKIDNGGVSETKKLIIE